MPVSEFEFDDAKKAFEIFDVYFRDEHVKVSPDFVPQFVIPESRRVQFKLSSRLLNNFEVAQAEGAAESSKQEFQQIEFVGEVRCATVPEDSSADAEVLLSIEIRLGLIYRVKGSCPDESIQDFVRLNAPYHAIPYWREHVHSVCAKRRFPPITVPMYTRAPKLTPELPSDD